MSKDLIKRLRADAEVAELKKELYAVSVALDDPRTDLTMTMVEVIADQHKERDQLRNDVKALREALENCRLLAARSRKESWALLILRFCAEGGVIGSVTRDNSDHHGPDWTERDGEYLK